MAATREVPKNIMSANATPCEYHMALVALLAVVARACDSHILAKDNPYWDAIAKVDPETVLAAVREATADIATGDFA